MNIEEFIPIKKEESEINQMSPLVWAYVGDCVYELYIRTYLVDNTRKYPKIQVIINNGRIKMQRHEPASWVNVFLDLRKKTG